METSPASQKKRKVIEDSDDEPISISPTPSKPNTSPEDDQPVFSQKSAVSESPLKTTAPVTKASTSSSSSGVAKPTGSSAKSSSVADSKASSKNLNGKENPKPKAATPQKKRIESDSSSEQDSDSEESNGVVVLSEKKKSATKSTPSSSSSTTKTPTRSSASASTPTKATAKAPPAKSSPAPTRKSRKQVSSSSESESESDSSSEDEYDDSASDESSSSSSEQDSSESDYSGSDDSDAPSRKRRATPKTPPKSMAKSPSKPATKSAQSTPSKPAAKPSAPTQKTPTKAAPSSKAAPEPKSTSAKPTTAKSAPAKPATKATRKSKSDVKDEDEDLFKSDDDSSVPKTIKGGRASTKRASKSNEEVKSEDEFEVKAPQKNAPKRRKTEPSSSQSSKKSKTSTSESDDEAVEWWNEKDDGRAEGIHWKSLVHNGVYFPPEYVPHKVKMNYNGKPIDLPPEAEEVATMFAALLESDYSKKEVFQNNFFRDWKDILKKCGVTQIQDFKKCDFKPIFDYLQQQKENKKSMTKEEKDVLKQEKQKIDDHYGFCILNGRKEKVGNFRVEPPGLFRGRGDHPKQGTLKKRIYPEDITINISEDAPIPPTLPGHKWKEVVHDQKVTWLAYWIENVQGGYKYVWLSATSSLKQKADMEKFEVARNLKDHIESIRKSYLKDLKSESIMERQRATALYFIDRLALRVGNEKDSDEADTVGCCSLRVEHIKLLDDNKVEFDFLGKDSMRYYNVVEVVPDVYKNLKSFAKGKKTGDELFEQISTTFLNNHLKKLMPKLTAKVFRTFNASFTLQKLLNEPVDAKASTEQKNHFFQKANREVAILCNHQRTLPKSFQSQMEKVDEKIQHLKDHLVVLEKIHKKLKSGADIPKTLLDEYAKTKSLKPPNPEKEEEKPKKESAPKFSLDSMKSKIDKLKTRIEKEEVNKQIKDDTKTVSLSTSKVNYLDPRITVAWCKKNDFPVEKIFNKSLMSKFPWAMEVDEDWEF